METTNQGQVIQSLIELTQNFDFILQLFGEFFLNIV